MRRQLHKYEGMSLDRIPEFLVVLTDPRTSLLGTIVPG